MSDSLNHFDETAELRLPERFGVYLRWPENGTQWIHPEDVGHCLQLIPSNRIFQRQHESHEYNRLDYGPYSIRVKPTLWLEVQTDGYLIGDRVEIRSRMGRRRPAIATIKETLYNPVQRSVDYVLSVNGKQLNEFYCFEDVQPVFKLGEPLDARQRELLDKSRLS